VQCFELLGIDVMFGADCRPWLLEANLDPSLSMEEVHGTPHGANARLKSQMLVDLVNLVGIRPPHHAEPSSSTTSAVVLAEAAYRSAEAARRLSPAEAQAAALRHVDAEYERAKLGGWRRLLPSDHSEHYARFVGEERREMHLLPFATTCGERNGAWAFARSGCTERPASAAR
jgi:hypothetical protein